MKWASTFVLVATLLLLATGTGRVYGKKELPIAPIFPSVVLEALGCDVCAYTIANFQQQLHYLREERDAKRQVVREDDMLELLDHLCNPLVEGGAWVRRVVLKWESPSKDLITDVTPHYNKCGSTCRSVSEVCDGVLDSDEAEKLTPLYLALLQNRSISLLNFSISEAVARALCSRGSACTARRANLDRLSAAAMKDPALYETVVADIPQEIEAEEMDMEEMMYKMWANEGKKTDVFDREEILKLQDAIARGDKEEARRLDPTSMDLTDDEFEELRRMYNGDGDGGGGGGGGDDEDAADL